LQSHLTWGQDAPIVVGRSERTRPRTWHRRTLSVSDKAKPGAAAAAGGSGEAGGVVPRDRFQGAAPQLSPACRRPPARRRRRRRLLRLVVGHRHRLVYDLSTELAAAAATTTTTATAPARFDGTPSRYTRRPSSSRRALVNTVPLHGSTATKTNSPSNLNSTVPHQIRNG